MLACMRLTVKFSVTAPTSSRRVIPASIIDLHQSANYCSNDTEHCLITDNSDTDMFTSLLGLLLRDSMSLNRTNRRMCIDGKKSYQCICPDKAMKTIRISVMCFQLPMQSTLKARAWQVGKSH